MDEAINQTTQYSMNKRTLLLSIVFHIILFILLTVTIHSAAIKPINNQAAAKQEPIKAITVDSKSVEKQLAFIKQRHLHKLRLAKEHQQHLQALKLAAARAKSERLKELKRLKALTAKRKVAQRELTKQHQLAEQTKRAQQAQLSKLQKANARAQAKLQALKVAEKKRKAALAAKHEAETLAKALAEKQWLAKVQPVINRYVAMIISQIQSKWTPPTDSINSDSCTLLVKIAADGRVLSAIVTQSSGKPLLDRSAVTAVYRASPLPIPAEQKLYEKFQQVSLTLSPKGFLNE